MRKISFFICQLILLISISFTAVAQVPSTIYAKPADYKAMMKRILVVELPQPDPKVREKLQKKAEKKPELLKEYDEFFTNYRELITKVVKNHWRLNEEIEFKESSEIHKIIEAKNTKYVILKYAEIVTDMSEEIFRGGVKVPILMYQRAEKTYKKPDYFIHIPSSYVYNGTNYYESDLILATRMMQDNIEYSIKVNKSTPFLTYGEKMMEENCKEMEGRTALVPKEFLGKKASPSEVEGKTNLKLEFVTTEEWNTSMVDGHENAMFFFVPISIARGAILNEVAIMYLRAFVDAKTGKIYYFYKPRTGDFLDAQLRQNEFTGMVKRCK